MITKLLFLLLSLCPFLLPVTCSFPSFRANLTRAVTTSNYARQVVRSKLRSSMLQSKATGRPVDARIKLKIGVNDYVMALAIGTPPLHLWAEADTGSDLVWTQCKPCTHCFSQPTPLFDPTKSSSFEKVPRKDPACRALLKDTGEASNTTECKYIMVYANRDFSRGYLATETFTFGAVSVPGISFGCGTANQGSFGNSAGLVGLGRGGLSLVTQIGLSNFSYCLTSDENKTSPLLFGTSLDLFKGSNRIQSTSFVTNPKDGSMYYVALVGITVGDRLVPIPKGTFDLKRDGSGGVIFDTGTTMTFLENIAYELVKQAFLSQMNFPVVDASELSGLDLCFKVGAGMNTAVPGMTLHFNGADMDLPQDNYFEEVDTKNGIWCLMMLGAEGLSVVGNVMQMNMHILYDLKNSMMSFQPADCNNL